MGWQHSSAVGFFAITLLLISTASAQTSARGVPPGEAAVGEYLPELAVTDPTLPPVPELEFERAILGSLDPSLLPDDTLSSPLIGAVAVVPPEIDENGLRNLPPVASDGIVGLNGKLLNESASEDSRSAAICGANSLQSSDYAQACKLHITWRNGQSGGCSAFIIGDRYLGTAGHCVFNKERGGFASSIGVYCKGNSGCSGQRNTYAVSFSAASGFTNSDTRYSNAYDGGVIKTKDVLPFGPINWGQRLGNYQTNVLIAGYPGQEEGIPNSPCQNYPQYNGCTQFTSYGTMSGARKEGFFFPDVDTCQGHSGSMMYDRNVGFVTGIWTGFTYQPCENLVVPLRVNEVDGGCNGRGGGVGLGCLAAAADRAAP